MDVKIGDVVILRLLGQNLNALVAHALPERRLHLVALSPHEGDVGTNGRLSEWHLNIPHQATVGLPLEQPRWCLEAEL